VSTVPGSFLENLAFLALLVFFVTPNRFLRVIHWGLASLLAAFVLGSGDASCVRDPFFWGLLIFGGGCVAFWLYGKLSPLSEREEPSRE
jgi:hypothetical protein